MSLDLLSIPIVPCFVGGEAFTGSSSFDVVDPHKRESILHSVSSITVADVEKIVDIAAAAGKKWKKTSVLQRRTIFLKAAALLRSRAAEYSAIEFGETTSSRGWSGFELSLAADSIEETAAAATVALRGEICTTDETQRAYIERCPFGVVLGMAPWNAPLVLGQRACTQPIMAGNAAILKTSEVSPKTQLILAQIFVEAGLPAGVLNVIHVAPQDAPAVVDKFISHPAIGKINFTGSTRVGAVIGATAGKYMKPVVLELGGKAPFLVLPDADLELATSALLFGGWFHSGQVCMATQTVIAHVSIVDQLIALIQQAASNVTASAREEDGANLRGVFTDASAVRTKEIVDDAIAKGAKIIAGKYEITQNVVQPLLLSNVTPEMRIYREEMFSPVFSLATYEGIDTAIEIANDHSFGLAAAIWTRDASEGYRIAREIDAGMVHINTATIHDSAQVPHGGWKQSGFGRFNGIEGIREFTQTKVITHNTPHLFPI